MDVGISPHGDSWIQLIAFNGGAYQEPACDELKSFDLDGENYGNPRVVGGIVDVGCDEVHGLIMAGSWANDSNSHNTPTGLNPSAVQALSKRYMILPSLYSGGNVTLTINATHRKFTTLPVVVPAWTQPPQTLSSPVVNPAHPVDFRKRYITFADPPAGSGVPWVFSSPGVLTHSPLNGVTGQLALGFTRAEQNDQEAVGLLSYFNAQCEVIGDTSGPNVRRWTNLQFEYR
jgi:hypothetical protein